MWKTFAVCSLAIAQFQLGEASADGVKASDGSKLNSGPITEIRCGTSFNECMRDCIREVRIDEKRVVITIKSWEIHHRPERKAEFPIPAAEWNRLRDAIDPKKFGALESRIGCPDCDDGGAEFVEIKTGSRVKRVSFSYKRDIPEISNFLKMLRKFRDDYLSRMAPN